MKTYFKIVFTLVALIYEFGFALPYLISAHSDELVLIGYAVLAISLPLYYLFWESDLKKLSKLV